jgi:hypothetical protein
MPRLQDNRPIALRVRANVRESLLLVQRPEKMQINQRLDGSPLTSPGGRVIPGVTASAGGSRRGPRECRRKDRQKRGQGQAAHLATRSPRYFVRDFVAHVGCDHTEVVLDSRELANPDLSRAVMQASDSSARTAFS